MSDISRDDLMAHLDGQLDPARRRAVEAHLAAHPEAAAELALLRRQADALRTLYGPVEAEPVPPRLDPPRLALAAGRRRRQGLARAAAVVLLLAIGMAAGWLLRPLGGPEPHERLIADAVSAHTVYVAENRHAVEVAGTDGAHLSSWLSSRLESRLAMPELAGEGLALLGGRLLPAPAIAGGRAAQLMYEDAAGERVTLYITPAAGIGGPAYEIVRFGADTALYWADAVFTCTIVGSQPPERLEAIARSVFAQLDPEGTPPARPYRDL